MMKVLSFLAMLLWAGMAHANLVASAPPPPHPISISPVGALVTSDLAADGAVAMMHVDMSDGTVFGGTLVLTDNPGGLWGMSGYTLEAPLGLSQPNNGTYNVGLKACENGQCLTGTITVTVNIPLSGGCSGPAGNTCPVGIAAPPGFHFSLQIEDLFDQDTAINGGLWDTSLSYPGTVYLDKDGLNLQPTTADANCYLESGARPCDAGIVSAFFPRYGVWEWSARYPRGWDGSGDGYHVDTYVNDNNSGDRLGYAETSVVGESVLGSNDANIANIYCCDEGGTQTVQVDYGLNSPTRFSDDFHIFSSLWTPPGSSPNGDVSNYIDGNYQFTGPQSSSWGSGGGTIIMESVSCYPPSQVYDGGSACSGNTATSGNPYTFRYFRYWSLVPN